MLNLSHYSLSQSVSHPEKIAARHKELGYDWCSIVDINTLGGCIQFYKACREHEIKPVLGCQVHVKNYGNAALFAKNPAGWKNLNKIVGLANRKLPLEITSNELLQRNDGVIIISDETFGDYSPDELCLAETRYLTEAEHLKLKVLMAVGDKSTIQNCSVPHHRHYRYFSENKWFPRKLEEFTPEQRKNTQKLLDEIEDFEITRPPQLPKFPCPGGKSSKDFLYELCVEGAKKKVGNLPKEEKEVYWDRLKYELGVFNDQNLSDYFLIVWDIIQYCKKKNYLVGSGRGSASGCLVSYLIGITQIDPLKYGLYFSRFFNEARKGSLPDIDFDIPKWKREDVIKYIVKRYGSDKVSHIVTYQTCKGKSSIKSVFRAIGKMEFSEINRITKNIVDESFIADELNEMESPSVVLWALENKPKEFAEWVKLNDDGTLSGEFADEFRLAIDLEDTKLSQSKHASGILISKDPLTEVCPMIYDNHTQKQVCGLEYKDAEMIGCIKVDALGLNLCDKLMDIQKDIHANK